MTKGPLTAYANALVGRDIGPDGQATGFGPVAPVRSGVSLGFDSTSTVATVDQTMHLAASTPPNSIASVHAEHVVSHVNSPGMGIDLLRTTADVSLDKTTFSLMTSPGVIGLNVSAEFIHSSSTASKIFGGPKPFLNGVTSFGSLNVSGLLTGSLSFSGDAKPNTVLFSSDELTITLNKTDLAPSVPGSTANAIRTDAIDIHFSSPLGGTARDDLVIGETYASINNVTVKS